MKLISWNVNGIRACVQKGFLDYMKAADADIFCIQESKLQEGQIQLDTPGYEQYWNYAKKKGYSGTAVFTKHTPLAVSYGIGMEEHDQEGRVITLEYPRFYLVTVYTPNSQNELARLDYRMKWEDDFLAYLKKLEGKKPVIFCGDLNVAHEEIDLKNPKTNRRNAGFTDEERENARPCSMPGLLIRTAIFIRTGKACTAGGPTASKPGRRTRAGVLIISAYPGVWKNICVERRYTQRYTDRITVRLNWILTCKDSFIQ